MKKMNGKWFILLFIAFAASASQAAWQSLNWDVKYDADLTPANTALNPSPIQQWNGSSYIDAGRMTQAGTIASQSVSDGILSASTANDTSGYFSKNITALPAMESSTGYTVELRAKVNDIDTDNTWMTVFSMEEATTGVNRNWSIQFLENPTTGGMAVRLSGANQGAYGYFEANSSREFHTFRITAEDSGVSLYMDDLSMVISTANYRDLIKNNFEFGDFTSTVDVDFEVDYVGLYGGGAVVPEPATLSVFVIGAVGLVLVRSRARR